jgi:hypothetical protein
MEYENTCDCDYEKIIRSIKCNQEPLIVMVSNRLELAAASFQIFGS